MDNLARIISHGFAIVVVVLLGIGFVYRGELFPGLELPDFLVPESGKTADTGTRPDRSQLEATAGSETSRGEPVEAMPSVPASAPEEATGITAQRAEEKAKAPEAAPAAEEAVEGAAARTTPSEAEEPATVSESTVETPPSAVVEPPTPVVEEQVPAEGVPTEETEAGGALPANAPPPVPSDESVVEPGVEEAVPGAGAQVGGGAQEPSPTPATTPEIAAESGSQTSGSEGQPAPSEANPEETAPGATMPPAESVPPSQPGVGSAGPAAGKSSTEPTEMKPYELLAAAREAFWLHQYDDAEKNYRALTELQPDNPDGYGELGNMYFAQGRWDEAAAAYYEAGARLVKEGRLESARALVKVIRGLNGKQADDLEKLVSSAAPPGNE